MKRNTLFNLVAAMGLACSLTACVNGKGEKGTPVDPETLANRDTVSTLSPNSGDFIVAETMQSASFLDFFKAEVDETGVVTCCFSDFENENFYSIFSTDCPKDPIVIQNVQGRCRGVMILNEGGDVNPVLLMIMEDDHAEKISLYNLSEGRNKPTHRSAQGGITFFESEISAEYDVEGVVGIAIDGSHIDIDWETI